MLIVFTAALFAIVLFTGVGMGHAMSWGMDFPVMESRMMGGWGLIGLAVVLFGVLIIVGAYILLQGFVTPRRDEHNRPLALAKERYARGEITLKEFEEIKKHLS